MSDHQLYFPQMLCYSSLSKAITGIAFLSLVSLHMRCRKTVRRSATQLTSNGSLASQSGEVQSMQKANVVCSMNALRALFYMVAKVSYFNEQYLQSCPPDCKHSTSVALRSAFASTTALQITATRGGAYGRRPPPPSPVPLGPFAAPGSPTPTFWGGWSSSASGRS